MKAEVIAVSKPYRPLKGETVLNDLKNAFPEFEYITTDGDRNGFVVRQSVFAGARIDVRAKQIRLKAKVPQPLAKVIDLALLGTISAASAPNVVYRLKKHMRKRYAG